MDDIFTVTSSALPSGTRVLAFTGTEAISLPYAFEVFLLVPAAASDDFDPSRAINQRASLAVLRQDETPRMHLHGVLASIELLHTLPGDHLYRVLLVPRLWLLGLSLHSRVFVDKTVPVIVDTVLRQGGLGSSEYEVRTSGSYRKVEHTCQYRESDLDFVSRLLEHKGIYYFFEQGTDHEKMVLVDNKAQHAKMPAEAVAYTPTSGADTSGIEGLRRFGMTASFLPNKVKVTDYDPIHPTLDVKGEAAAAPTAGDMVVRHGMDHFFTPRDGNRVATSRGQHILAEHKVFSASGRAFEMRSGYKFELTDHPRAAFNGQYLVTQVEHRGSNASAAPEAAALLGIFEDEVYAVDILAIKSDVQYRPPLATPKPRIHGLESAIVDGGTDSEYGQLDAHGRYLVRFRFDEAGSPAGKASTRVRMAQPHAGSPEGWHQPLRKGTEVLVSFLGGDPDRPLIAGTVADSRNVAPVTAGNGTRNVYHTGGNNRFELEDTDGSQHIDLSSPDNSTLLHMGNPHDGINYNFASTTEGNGLVHTGLDYNVTVGANKTENVKTEVSETYHDTQDTKVTKDVTETYKTFQFTEVTGHVEEKYKTHTTKVKSLKKESTATQKITVDGALEESVGLQLTTVSGTFDEKAADQTVNVSAASLENYATITLNVDSTLDVSAGGLLLMSGPSITFAPTAMTVTTTVYVEVNGPKIDHKGPKPSTKGIAVGLNLSSTTLVGLKNTDGSFALGLYGQKTSLLGGRIEMFLTAKIELCGVNNKITPFQIEAKTLELL